MEKNQTEILICTICSYSRGTKTVYWTYELIAVKNVLEDLENKDKMLTKITQPYLI